LASADSSTMIVSGQKGDASILRPTTMPCVPIILDRIYKSLRAKISAKSVFFQVSDFMNLNFGQKVHTKGKTLFFFVRTDINIFVKIWTKIFYLIAQKSRFAILIFDPD
jgi:long-subunit acyl-CoA synthetase (AMP-forming)